MKKWKTALLVTLLLAGPVLILIRRARDLTEALQALRAAPGGEAAGNAVLVDPVLVAAVPAALLLILWFVIRFLFSRIGRNRVSKAYNKLRDPEK